MIRSMAPDPIVFALAVPEPEITPDEARERRRQGGRHRPLRLSRTRWTSPSSSRASSAGCSIRRARNIRLRMLLYAAQALAGMVEPDELHADHIVPRIFRLPGRAGDRGGGRARRERVGRGSSRDRARDRGRAHPALRLRRAADCRPSPSTRDENKTFREEAIDLRVRHGGVLEIHSQDPDPRPPHPQPALRSAGRARAGPRHPR